MSASVSQVDFNIYYVEDGYKQLLPYAFYNVLPTFAWDLPEGIIQASYIFEIRTFYPVLYSDGITYRCAYYNSGQVYNTIPQHIMEKNIISTSWYGTCQVRLSIIDADGNEYCTHQQITNGMTYDFETDHPQYRKWGSKNDHYYFCYDNIIDTTNNKQKVNFSFRRSQQQDLNQELKYTLQISQSPLFGQGNDIKSLVEVNDIYINDLSANISALFQTQKQEQNLIEESINSLKPNTLYFGRARSFDGYDYSDWSITNAFKMYLNSIPKCYIWSIKANDITIWDSENNSVPWSENIDNNERQNGELTIEFSIQDEDSKYVSAELCFSMPVSEKLSQSLGCAPNYSQEAVDYDNETQKTGVNKLIRVRTKESIFKIPTNTHLYVTWLTNQQIQDTIKQPVFLYLNAYDGLNQATKYVTSRFTIDNTNVGYNNKGTSLKALQFWLKGRINWSFYYPVIPDAEQKSLIVCSVDKYNSSSSTTITQIGCQESWLKTWMNYENGSFEKHRAKYGLQRVTQNGSFKIIKYDKYFNLQSRTQDGTYSTSYTEEVINSSSNEASFVMFCPSCKELHILRTYILRQDGKVFETLQEAFPNKLDNNGNPIDGYDGSHYTLIFRCPYCNKTLPMNYKYQQDLSYRGRTHLYKTCYSYYIGYNSVQNPADDDVLIKQTLLTRDTQYKTISQEYKRINGQDYYEKITLLNQTNSQNKNTNKEKSIWGMMPQDALLRLTKRPQYESYMKVHAPKSFKYHHAVYYDGVKLSHDMEKNYMHKYEDTPDQQDSNNTIIPGTPGDDNLLLLATQAPWAYNNPMMYQYFYSLSKDQKKDTVVYNPCFNASNPCVSHITFTTGQNKVTQVFNRLSCKLQIHFPVNIQSNINDNFKVIINSEKIIKGSLLNNNNSSQTISFPYYTQNGKDYIKNSQATILVEKLNKIFGEAFDITINDIPAYTSSNVMADKSIIIFTVYGKMQNTINKFQLKNCNNNCYDLFTINPFTCYQSYQTFQGQPNGPFLFLGKLPTTVYDQTKVLGKYKKILEQQSKDIYYYTAVKINDVTAQNTKDFEYVVTESPVDNTIENSYGILSTQSSGQPLFTCYKDEVDKNGYHFKYTEQDFKKTGKIYIRTYHMQPCNSFSLEGFGYRDWIVMPIDPVNKPGRYYKKKVLNGRGKAPITKQILVKLNEKVIIRQDGYFQNEYTQNAISHKLPSSSASQTKQEEQNEKVYERIDFSEWRSKVIAKVCIVFDYVQIQKAITKNITDYSQGINPFNHKPLFSIRNGIASIDKKDEYYGIYVLGAYDLTSTQKDLLDKQSRGQDVSYYDKVFHSSAMALTPEGIPYESDVQYTVKFPSNITNELIKAPFVVDKSESTRKSFLVVSEQEITNRKLQPVTSSSSFGEIKQIDTYEKYKKQWLNKLTAPSDRKFLEFTVQQFNPAFNFKEQIVKKYGYIPTLTMQTPFKQNNNDYLIGKYIPLHNNTVHAITKDPYIDYRLVGKFIKQRHIISDKTFVKTDDTYDKLPYLDYILKGRNIFDYGYYFSGYPQSQHKSYSKRPKVVYDYDRQWRIGGLNKKDKEDKFTYNSGLFIENSFQSYTSQWIFYYLQQQFNTYNRLHWASVQDENQYACLYAQRVNNDTNESIGEPISIQTKTSIWNSSSKIWCIPYNYQMSDLIDVQENGLVDGYYYKFYMKLISKTDSKTGASDDTINSIKFKISKTAVSPAIILQEQFDPWTKKLTLSFRFDDALGREYDITGLQYIQTDTTVSEIGNQYTKVVNNNWIDIEGYQGIIDGEIFNLKSNRYGDNVASKNLIIIHKIIINLADIGVQASSSFRIRIISSLALERQGLTYPVFTIKMLPNEILDPIEQKMLLLNGFDSRWTYEQTFDEQNQQTVGEWKYLQKKDAIYVVGSIQQKQQQIQAIEDIYDTWIEQKIKFAYDDLDSFERWLSYNDWDKFYYIYFFYLFLRLHEDDKYIDNFNEYIDNLKNNYDQHIRNSNFISKYKLANEYNEFYKQHRLYFLLKYFDEINVSGDFFPEIKDYETIRGEFIQSYVKEYKKYFNLEDSSSQSQNESSSSSRLEVDDDTIMDFIIHNDLQSDFIIFCGNYNYYEDTRFQERALIMFKKFKIATPNLFEFINTQQNPNEYTDIYTEWLNNNHSKYKNLSDIYQMFLSYITDENDDIYAVNENNQEIILEENNFQDENIRIVTKNSNNYLMNKFTLNKYGRMYARIEFMQLKNENYCSYNNLYLGLLQQLNQYKKQLNEYIMTKTKIETQHRQRLIQQGYFCNGFYNNQVFDENGDINICFRWRVQTQQYQGEVSTDSIGINDKLPIYSFDERFNMYARFQLDFFDTFNSQTNQKPLRDIIFTQNSEDDGYRILASTQDVDNSARTTPNSTLVSNYTNSVSNNNSNDTYNADSYTSLDNNITQKVIHVNLPKIKLPGQYSTDELPQPWVNCWSNVKKDNFKSAYFWRIAPYNIVESPVFDMMIGTSYVLPVKQDRIMPSGYYHGKDVTYYETQAILSNIYRLETIKAGTYEPYIYVAYDKLIDLYKNNNTENYVYSKNQNIHWAKNNESIAFDSNLLPYTNSWVNKNVLLRGQVQFVTDRPRKIYVGYTEQQKIEQNLEYYYHIYDSYDQINGNYNKISTNTIVITRYNIQNCNDEINGKYDLLSDIFTVIDDTYYQVYYNNNKYLYKTKYNNENHWVIGNKYTSQQTDNDDLILISLNEKNPESVKNWYLINQNNNIQITFKIQYDSYPQYYKSETSYYIYYALYNNAYRWILGKKSDLQESGFTPLLFSQNVQSPDLSNEWYEINNDNQIISIKLEKLFVSSSSSQSDEIIYNSQDIKYIEDNIGNFDINWIPESVIRNKPFVITKDNNYLLFSHKVKNVKSVAREIKDQIYEQYVITMSRGFANNIFGEEITCLNKYDYLNPSDIIPNALSFENPCVIKLPNNSYRMYFNVLFDVNKNLQYQIYKADTDDFDTWYDISKVTTLNKSIEFYNNLQPFINIKQYVNEDQQIYYIYEMYTSYKSSTTNLFNIIYYTSVDGVNFNYVKIILPQIDSDNGYNFRAPFIMEDNNDKKLYCTIRSSNDINGNYAQMIISVKWDFNINDWSKTVINGNSRLIIEKGNNLQQTTFQGIFNNSKYSNCCIINDVDYGFIVKRMYFNTYDTPYLWKNNQLIYANGISQKTIHTEYLQEYKWYKEGLYDYTGEQRTFPLLQYVNVNDVPLQGDITWKNPQQFISNTSDQYNDTTSIPDNFKLPANSYIKYHWFSIYQNIYGIKIKTSPNNSIVTCMSQGDWIDFNNVNETTALLKPETTDYDYDVNNYTQMNYIQQQQIYDGFIKWMTQTTQATNISEFTESQQKELALQFLKENKYYPKYIWWSRKGAGIYRYVGYDIMKDYQWQDCDRNSIIKT